MIWNLEREGSRCATDLSDTVVLNGQSVVTARSKGRVKKPGMIASWSVSERNYTVVQNRSEVVVVVVDETIVE